MGNPIFEVGDIVKRGPEWQWGIQDEDERGIKCFGEIMKIDDSSEWGFRPPVYQMVKVIWSHKKTNGPWYGHDGKHDLDFAYKCEVPVIEKEVGIYEHTVYKGLVK